MQVISEDHYTIDVTYAHGPHRYDRSNVGTRYVYVIIRMLVDPRQPEDLEAVHNLQDAITAEQPHTGSFEVPDWDSESQAKARQALATLESLGGATDKFGTREEVNPIDHLIGAAVGWGGNPKHAANYISVYPLRNDGTTIHVLTVGEVPVDGFWSISVYNEQGFFEKNDLGVYSINNVIAKNTANGSYRIQFGGCQRRTANCLPISKGWNYTVRLYRPRAEILDGTWQFPEAQPVN
jgi:para-nitrobenzyl esterase